MLWNRTDRRIDRAGGRAAVVMDGQRRCGRDFRHLSWNRADRRIDHAGGGAAVVMDGQRRCGRDFPAFVMEPGGQAYWPRRRQSRRGDGRTRIRDL